MAMNPEVRGGITPNELLQPRRTEHTEFLRAGGVIREANLPEDAEHVRNLYVDPSVIEHLADVTPDYQEERILDYYSRNPSSCLLVAELPGVGIVGALTVAPEEGLRSAKLNRLATNPDYRRRRIAYRLLRSGLSLAFSSREAGGLGCEQVFLAVIQDIDGYEAAEKTFRSVGFENFGSRLKRRCDSWDARKGKLVERDVQQMVMQRGAYSLRYGRDLRKNYPFTPPVNSE